MLLKIIKNLIFIERLLVKKAKYSIFLVMSRRNVGKKLQKVQNFTNKSSTLLVKFREKGEFLPTAFRLQQTIVIKRGIEVKTSKNNLDKLYCLRYTVNAKG